VRNRGSRISCLTNAVADERFIKARFARNSRDVRRHVDWLLDQVGDRALTLAELRAAACGTVPSCCSVSATGHGGPMLWPEQLRLAECGLELWFDVYFASRVGAV
jgi:hypothetical protein